jgi:hypothetical protein
LDELLHSLTLGRGEVLRESACERQITPGSERLTFPDGRKALPCGTVAKIKIFGFSFMQILEDLLFGQAMFVKLIR